jgi:hypothetical protein
LVIPESITRFDESCFVAAKIDHMIIQSPLSLCLENLPIRMTQMQLHAILPFAVVEAIGYHQSTKWTSTKFAIIRFETDEDRDETLRRLNYVELYGWPLIFVACDKETTRIQISKKGIICVRNSSMNYRQIYDLCCRFGRMIAIWKTKNGDSYVQFYEQMDAVWAVFSLKDSLSICHSAAPWSIDDCGGQDESPDEKGEEVEVDEENLYVFQNHHRRRKDGRIRRRRRRDSRGPGRRMARGITMSRQAKQDTAFDDGFWDFWSDYDPWDDGWWADSDD